MVMSDFFSKSDSFCAHQVLEDLLGDLLFNGKIINVHSTKTNCEDEKHVHNEVRQVELLRVERADPRPS